MTRTIRLGILRLVDSAPALVAAHRELFAREGLHVRLCIEPSWANVADKLAYGLLDAAIMLPPLAIAAALGLRGPRTRLIVPAGIKSRREHRGRHRRSRGRGVSGAGRIGGGG